MPKKGKHKNRRPTVQVAADSGPIKLGTTSNPNDWETCTKEEQLEIIIRKKLDHLFGEALSRLVGKGYDEDVALKGLLERGYCVGEADCLSNVVQNCLEFLTGKDDVESEQQDQPKPFQNLELLVEFNLFFMLYILQKYRPNLNRMSILRCILMTDLNLNRAIIMKISDTPFEIKDKAGDDLNLEGDDGDNREKDRFLDLEIRELFNNLNFLDESISEDMKDAMIAGLQKPIDDLKPQLEERIRWASKKVAEARRKQPSTRMTLVEEIELLKILKDSKVTKRDSELASVNNELTDAEKTVKLLEMEKEEIKAEISASKLLVSEARQKLLEVSKKGKKKNSEKQKEELQEEIELEKKKISKWNQDLVETEAALIPAVVKLGEVIETRKAIIAQVDKEHELVLESWDNDMLLEQVGRLTYALIKARYEVQDTRTEFIRMLSKDSKF
ncbi:MND1-interacting protein 1-like [Impatiens glandulifera]|uniref:MND1-interacting protein 1-like n=1 Tax=Impatiens glandulifera TaxID=253017 RepID=UPI001FB073C1|nr:MND1-interacting protein 1-like [Impatiens glandulifera]